MRNKIVKSLTENLLLDIIVFAISVLLLLSLSWQVIILLIFPIITFGFLLIIRIGTGNLTQDYSEYIYPVFHKKLLGKLGDIFSYVTTLLIIFTYWLSLDSFIFPQSILSHTMFITIITAFIFSFAFYWIFTEFWKRYNFNTIFEGIDLEDFPKKNHQNILEQLDSLLTILKLNVVRNSYLINSLVIIALNVVNVIISIFTYNNILPGVMIALPGTGFENSLPISLSYSFFIVAFVSPLVAIISVVNLRRKIAQISLNTFTNCINDMPKEIKTKIEDNLNHLSNFYDEDL